MIRQWNKGVIFVYDEKPSDTQLGENKIGNNTDFLDYIIDEVFEWI